MRTGVDVDHTINYRWVQRYAPEIEKRLRWYRKRPPIVRSWRVDETYVKVGGKWVNLYRAVDKDGDTIDFYLSSARNAKAAKRFLGKALHGLKDWEKPLRINTDKASAYGVAVRELKAEGKCLGNSEHRQIKYLNNVVEADHGKLKRLIKPTLGFKSMKTAYATLKGFEVMHALSKGQRSSPDRTQLRHLFRLAWAAADPPPFGFGYNVAVFTHPHAVGAITGRGMFLQGRAAGTWFWVDPARDIVFVAMIQRFVGDGGLQHIQALSRTLVQQARWIREGCRVRVRRMVV